MNRNTLLTKRRSIPLPAARSTRRPGGSRLRVLLAEDDADFRTYLARILRAEGYAVTEVADGSGLLAELGLDSDGCATTFDVIITDVQMPGVTGTAVLEGLSWVGPDMHIVVISAFADPALVERATRLGASEVLSKPFARDALLGAVHRAARPRPGGPRSP